ncbi:adipolin [Callorhinchus milii]|uniref:Adipolin n=1 Tax=Callorhinchus milii TaxID=7868 RepID=A0A4W3I205_CALMI|nr:adipolin [Callorhinchus milii]|eukprot:gi/632934260/ref/XP_007905187.1/ PREDICTED: protein FAM132A-like [Callorhinchus milii]
MALILTVTLCVYFMLIKPSLADRAGIRSMDRKTPPPDKDLEEIINVPEFTGRQLPDTVVDPHDTWLLFVEHSEKGGNDRRRNKGKMKKTQHGLPGPAGPPGPQGPPGPPGAVVTKEELLQEFKEMVKEVVEERNRFALQEKCQECSGMEDNLRSPTSLPWALGPYRRLEAGFHCKLKDDMAVDRRSMRELQNFHIPEKDGVFLRGIGLNLTSGLYVAPLTGFYQFSANIHIEHREHQRRRHTRTHDNIRVLICIESLCQNNASLEAVYGLDGNSNIFTMFVSGALYLQALQYISVFVENGSSSPVTIQNGSDFTGILLGM